MLEDRDTVTRVPCTLLTRRQFLQALLVPHLYGVEFDPNLFAQDEVSAGRMRRRDR